MSRFFLCGAILVTGSSVFAQGGGGGGTGGGGAAGGSGASSSSSGMALNTTAIATNGSAGLATIGSQSTTGGSSSSSQAVSTSNFLSGSYNNPYYPGRPNSTQLGIAMGSGGFGTPSFGTTSGAIGGNGTTGANRAGGSATATTGGRAGGATGGTSTATKYTGGSLGTANSQISYMAVLKFAVPPVDERQKQIDLQDSLKSTVSLENANSFQVTLESGVVVVRGRAKDDEERRLVENMLRLEPGVRDVRNQIEVK